MKTVLEAELSLAEDGECGVIVQPQLSEPTGAVLGADGSLTLSFKAPFKVHVHLPPGGAEELRKQKPEHILVFEVTQDGALMRERVVPFTMEMENV